MSEPATGVAAEAASGRYSVRVLERGTGWEVRILDAGERPVFARAARTEVEARTFASTVRQHLHWLSVGKFREYYRIPSAG